MMQEVDRQPNGSAPVRVAAEQVGGGFARFVVEAILLAIELHHQGIFQVIARDERIPYGERNSASSSM